MFTCYLYNCENLTAKLRKEQRLRVFEDKIPIRIRYGHANGIGGNKIKQNFSGESAWKTFT